jgi:hypothetical protein
MKIELSKLRDWESGVLTPEQEIAFFQSLIDSGLAWKLGGKYMRRAGVLIAAGKVTKQDVAETA